MKAASIMAGLLSVALASAAWADPGEEAAKRVVEAVQRGDDLGAVFPGTISKQEAAALQRVSWCVTGDLIKQEEGRYTLVWDCGPKGALGMEVKVGGGRVISIATKGVVRAPSLSLH